VIAGVDPAQCHRTPAAQQQLQLPDEHDLPQPQAGDLISIIDTSPLENTNGADVPAQKDEDSDSDDEDEPAVNTPGEAEPAALVPVPAQPPPDHNLTRTRVPLSDDTTPIIAEPNIKRIPRDICKPACDATFTSPSFKVATATESLPYVMFHALRVKLLEWDVND